MVLPFGKYLMEFLKEINIFLANLPTILFDRPTEAVCSCKYTGFLNIQLAIQTGTDTNPPEDIIIDGFTFLIIEIASKKPSTDLKSKYRVLNEIFL